MVGTAQLTYERLREAVFYDPILGTFTWLHDAGSRARIGNPAGSAKKGRHTLLMIDNVLYKAHRLAFFYMMRRWPTPEDDHENLEKSDNRWCNIREATRSQNMANTPLRRTNTSGLKGVSWAKDRNAWRAQITVNRRNRVIGTFRAKDAAHAAYRAAAAEAHGAFARSG